MKMKKKDIISRKRERNHKDREWEINRKFNLEIPGINKISRKWKKRYYNFPKSNYQNARMHNAK